MRAAEVLGERWRPIVRARLNHTLEASNDAELKIALDARARAVLPGISAEALTNLLINVSPEQKHMRAEVDRIVVRTLFWSGILGGEEPGPSVDMAARGRISTKYIHKRSTTPITGKHFGTLGLDRQDERSKDRLLTYMVIAALHIYESIGGDPINTTPVEESWGLWRRR